MALPASAAAASYFVDCSAASSGNGSQASPFNSLAAINAVTLAPGDAVSFRRATTCTGSFVPKGSGTASAPVTIGAYGTGRLPAINAGGATQAAWIDSVPYTRDSWHRLGLRLRPATGRYDVIFDGRSVASPALGSSAGSASVRLNLPAGAAATFAADDVLVQPCL